MSDTPEITMSFDGENCFIVLNGERIAKRDHQTWISLVPGWSVISSPDLGSLTVTSNVCE